MRWVGIFLVLISPLLFADTRSAQRPGQMAIVDVSANNLTTGYDGADALVLSGLNSPANIAVWNESGGNVGVSVPNGSTCLVSSADNFVAPGVAGGGSGIVVDNVGINKIVCLRSLTGGTLSTGTVYVSTW